jgi:gas vesicle protein
MTDESKGPGLVWLLAGLGIGALVGILFAPKSGRETREDIGRSAREGTERLSTRTKRVAEHSGTLMDKGKQQVGEHVERGRSLMDDQSSSVAAVVEAGRAAYWTTQSGSKLEPPPPPESAWPVIANR